MANKRHHKLGAATGGERVGQVLNGVFLGLMVLVTIYPFWHVVMYSLSDSHVIAGGRTADRFSTSCTTSRDSSSRTTSRDSSARAPHPVHNIPQPMHKAIYVKEKIAFPLVFPLIISPFDGLSG